MDNQKKSGRAHLLYIDFLRTAAILSVIFLHCFSDYFADPQFYGTKTWFLLNLFNSVSRFGVPVFFMISGHLLLNQSESDNAVIPFLKKRMSKILIPLIFWSAVYYIFFTATENRTLSAADFISKFISCDTAYHLWFLYTLILLYLIIPVFRPFISKASIKQIFYLLAVIMLPVTFFPLINKLSGIWLFRFDPVINGYFGYMILGVLLGKSDLYEKKSFRITIYCSGIAALILTSVYTFIKSGSDGIDVFFNGGYQLNSFIIASAVFVLLRRLSEKINEGSALNKFLRFSGRCSFGVYLSHVLILSLIEKYICFPSIIIRVICSFLICTALSFALTAILIKIPVIRKTVV